MRFVLLLIMSVSGDVETTQVPFESEKLCERAQKQIVETAAAGQSDYKVLGAHCMEVRY